MSFLSFIPIIGDIIDKIFGGIDKVSTTDEERLQWKAELSKFQSEVITQIVTIETKYLEAQQSVLAAEMQYGNWLTRSWRPMVMLMFASFVVWFGIGTAFKIPVPDAAFIDNMMTLIKIGMGGYIVGRSGEKIATNIVEAMKKKEQI